MSKLKLFGVIFAGITVVAIVAGGMWAFRYWDSCANLGCPDVTSIQKEKPATTSRVYDNSGREIASFYRVQRTLVPLSEVPWHVVEAFVAVEDQRFWEHEGVDWPRIVGAVKANLQSRRYTQGFSSITMQLASNVFPEALPKSEKTIIRKLREMRVALEIEKMYTKEQILERYLNLIYFGAGAYGIEAAAQEYFDKSAGELTVAEGALLAGLPKSPSTLDPHKNSQGAIARRDLILTLMRQQGKLSPTEAAEALREPVVISASSTGEYLDAPHFVEMVRKELYERFGDELLTGGLRIHTTLDSTIQHVVEEKLFAGLDSLSAEIRSEETLQGSMIVMDPETGAVLGYVGGRDFDESKFDRASQAKRQPGSAFKPLVFLAALEEGYPLSYPLPDVGVVLEGGPGELWQPKNYGGQFMGRMPLRESLMRSRNIPAIWLTMDMGGPEKVVELANRIKLGAELPAVPSVALGAGEVSLLNMVAAYGVFANLGERVEPRFVTRVENSRGDTLWAPEVSRETVADPESVYLLTRALRDVVDRGTGYDVRRNGFTQIAAGKTGTTNNAADVWFMGFTKEIVAGVWMGFDTPEQIDNEATGGKFAAPIWAKVMSEIAPEEDPGDWAAPDSLISWPVYAGGIPVPVGCPDVGSVDHVLMKTDRVLEGQCFAHSQGEASGEGYSWFSRKVKPRPDDEDVANYWASFRGQILGRNDERERVYTYAGDGSHLVVDLPRGIRLASVVRDSIQQEENLRSIYDDFLLRREDEERRFLNRTNGGGNR